jgi:polyhydroxybutyrate depolymerase
LPPPPPPASKGPRPQPLRSALAALASAYAGPAAASPAAKHAQQPQPAPRCRGRQCSQPRSPPSAPPPAPPSPGALSPFSYARWSADAAECASAPVPAPKPGAHVHTFEFGGQIRRFILRTPPQAAERATVATPLVLELPGSHETAEHAAARSQLGATGAKYGFLVASLEGVDQLFNVGADARLESDGGADEVAYVAAVLAAVQRLACVDQRRVFASGFSRGARLTARLASELPSAIAAIGPVAGLRYPTPNNATRAIPVLAVHGLADAINPYAGGGPAYWRSGVPDAVGGWVAHNRCAPAPTTEPLGAHSARVEWTGCSDGAKVVLILLAGAGHSYPGCGHGHTGARGCAGGVCVLCAGVWRQAGRAGRQAGGYTEALTRRQADSQAH